MSIGRSRVGVAVACMGQGCRSGYYVGVGGGGLKGGWVFFLFFFRPAPHPRPPPTPPQTTTPKPPTSPALPLAQPNAAIPLRASRTSRPSTSRARARALGCKYGGKAHQMGHQLAPRARSRYSPTMVYCFCHSGIDHQSAEWRSDLQLSRAQPAAMTRRLAKAILETAPA